MTLQQVIDIADEICPNTFSKNMKAMWVSECEGIVQTEVLLRAIDEIDTYRYSASLNETVTIDEHKIIFSTPHGFSAGGMIQTTDFPSYEVVEGGLTVQVSNNLTAPARITHVSADGLVVTVDATFAFAEYLRNTGADLQPEEGEITYDGSTIELLVLPPHDKLYYPYLCAMIELAMHEYSKYENYKEEFNERLGEYTRWFATFYRPADRRYV